MSDRRIPRIIAVTAACAALGLTGASSASAQEQSPEPAPPTTSQSGLGNIEPPICLPPVLTGNGIGRACEPAPGETFRYPERTDGSKPGLLGMGIAGLL